MHFGIFLLVRSSLDLTLCGNFVCSPLQLIVNYATGRERKEDGKPCVTSVTIILFEITFRQTLLSNVLSRSFCKRPENTDVSEVHNKTRK